MRIAIIGCGHMAQVHIPYVLKIKNVQLAAVCDSNEIRAKELAQKYNIPYFTDTSKMLDEIKPEAVHILTPPQTHADITIKALIAGCHVLVEKPLCLTSQEVDAIYDAAEEAGCLVSVDHTHLWSSLFQKALQIIESGRCGKVVNIQYVMGDDFLEAVKTGYGRWALDLRGGVFCDLITHPLYLIRAFLPHVKVASARASGTGIKDLRELWVNFTASGVGANLWMSLNQRPLEHAFRIYCTGGIIHVDLRNFYMTVVPNRGLPGPAARVVNTLSDSWQRGMSTIGNAFKLIFGRFDPKVGTAGAIKAFYQAVNEDKPSPVSKQEARATVQLSEDIWNLLETTSGFICQEVEDNGKVIMHKTPADFVKNNAGESSTILVTGGTGFIGHHLIKRLVSEGKSVRVLCRRTSNLDQLPSNSVELTFGDVSDFESVKKAMQGIDVLYHLAATTGGDWAEHYIGTVVGTKNVLQAASEARVNKVVYVSSMGVLHSSRFPRNGCVDENFPLENRPKARGDYSRAKLEAEEIAREYIEKSLDLCIIRPGIVYGPGNSEFISDAGFKVSKRLILVVGMGVRKLGLTYVENLVDALLLAAQSQDSCGKVYHIVDPDPPKVRKYIYMYRRASGEQQRALYIPTFLWLTGFRIMDGALHLLRRLPSCLSYRLLSICKSPRYDTTAAQKKLGWMPRVSFEEGMRKTFEHQEEGR